MRLFIRVLLILICFLSFTVYAETEFTAIPYQKNQEILKYLRESGIVIPEGKLVGMGFETDSAELRIAVITMDSLLQPVKKVYQTDRVFYGKIMEVPASAATKTKDISPASTVKDSLRSGKEHQHKNRTTTMAFTNVNRSRFLA